MSSLPDGRTALSAFDLVKTYPTGRRKPPVRALDGLCLDVPAGSVFALLGPNGAGKSTAVKIFATLSRPDSGHATVAGVDVVREPDKVRRRIGLVSQKASSDPMATARENLVLAGQIQGMSRNSARARAQELVDPLRAWTTRRTALRRRTPAAWLASSMSRSVWCIGPPVLFLDEPTTGLDPEARAQMWAEIGRLAGEEQVSVLLTTHYLDEADQLADRLAIVDHGRVVVNGSPDAAQKRTAGRHRGTSN